MPTLQAPSRIVRDETRSRNFGSGRQSSVKPQAFARAWHPDRHPDRLVPAGPFSSLTIGENPDHGQWEECQAPRDSRTSRRMTGRSVMMPSTPRSSSRCISAASSIVHTWTCSPSRWARSTNLRVDHDHRALLHGDLSGKTGRVAEQAEAQQCRFERAEGAAQLRPECLAQASQPTVAERRDAHPGQRVRAAQ